MGTLVLATDELLKARFSLPTYRRLMSYPHWNYFTQSLVASRAYEKGLDACLILLRYTEENQKELSAKECERNLGAVYYLLLKLLDRLDRWEEYVALWDGLRLNVSLSLSYDKAVLDQRAEEVKPFILSNQGSTVEIHFLYLTLDRKELIERKLARKRAGKKLGNLMHSQQDELSEPEIRRRLERIKERIAYGEKISELIRQARADVG